MKKFIEGVKNNERPRKIPDVPDVPETVVIPGDSDLPLERLSQEDLSLSDCTQESKLSQSRKTKRTNLRRISEITVLLLGFSLCEFAQWQTNRPPDVRRPPRGRVKSSNPRNVTDTVAVYIYSNREVERIQRRKIEELYSFFKDRLIVVTDETPETNMAPVPSEQIVSGDSMQPVTNEHLFHHECCDRERAMTWLIKHHKEYKRAWIIDSGVNWKNFTDLQAIFDTHRYDNTDLLHENKGMEQQYPINESSDEIDWWNLDKIRFPKVRREAQLPPPYYHGLFMLYRISSRLATGLDEWRVSRNAKKWTLFEPLLSNWPLKHNMTTKSFVDNDVVEIFHEEYRRSVEILRRV